MPSSPFIIWLSRSFSNIPVRFRRILLLNPMSGFTFTRIIKRWDDVDTGGLWNVTQTRMESAELECIASGGWFPYYYKPLRLVALKPIHNSARNLSVKHKFYFVSARLNRIVPLNFLERHKTKNIDILE